MVGMVIASLANILGASDKIYEIMHYKPKIQAYGGDKIEAEVTG